MVAVFFFFLCFSQHKVRHARDCVCDSKPLLCSTWPWLATPPSSYFLHATRTGGGGGDEVAPPLDNPDQRLTADAAALTTAFAAVVHATLVVPVLVVFYTWYLVGMFGWIAPSACYVYFIVASAANW